MPRIVHFEIPVDDLEKSQAFYSTVFGWTFTEFGGMGYYLIKTGDSPEPGIDGGMMKRHHPEQPITNTIGVDSVDAYLEKVIAAGGSVALPKMAIPGVGWLAYFKDPEGHISGLHQLDPSAA